jgi:hypothetical protein
MKVYSLYYKDTFVVAFLNREDTIQYGKKYYDKFVWDCNIVEEYLNKTPYQNISTPNTINPITDKPPYPANLNVWCGTPQTNPYSNVRAE